MGLLQGAVAAMGLGIWTSLQPCPIGDEHRGHLLYWPPREPPGLVLVAGLLYALGRTIAYVVLAILLLERRPVGVANIYLP